MARYTKDVMDSTAPRVPPPLTVHLTAESLIARPKNKKEHHQHNPRATKNRSPRRRPVVAMANLDACCDRGTSAFCLEWNEMVFGRQGSLTPKKSSRDTGQFFFLVASDSRCVSQAMGCFHPVSVLFFLSYQCFGEMS